MTQGVLKDAPILLHQPRAAQAAGLAIAIAGASRQMREPAISCAEHHRVQRRQLLHWPSAAHNVPHSITSRSWQDSGPAGMMRQVLPRGPSLHCTRGMHRLCCNLNVFIAHCNCRNVLARPPRHAADRVPNLSLVVTWQVKPTHLLWPVCTLLCLEAAYTARK